MNAKISRLIRISVMENAFVMMYHAGKYVQQRMGRGNVTESVLNLTSIATENAMVKINGYAKTDV